MELKTKDVTKIKYNNNRFSLTNGQIFLLGILEENAVKDSSVFIANDKVLFNPLFTILKADNQLLSPKFQKPISHRQSYQIEEDILYRSTSYLVNDVKVSIKSERFIDKEEMIIYTQYQFKTSDKISVDLYHGIDDTNHTLNQGVESFKSKLHEMTLKTTDGEYMVLMYNKDFRHKNRNKSNQPTEHYTIETEPNRIYSFTKVIGYGPRVRRLKKLLKYKLNQSYEKIKEEHIDYKKNQLQQNKMKVVSHKKIDILLSYVYRQYFNEFPTTLSLNQTGLEDYTQMIFYLYNHPDMAKQKLLKQIKMIKQYKKDAESLGYQGAIIVDSIKDFNSGNRAIYRGALFIYLIELYQQMTNDFSLIDEGALELSIEICRFYYDYSEFNQIESHLDFRNVSNLNQSLNHINNHTLTNYLIRKAVKTTKTMISKNKKSDSLNKYSIVELKEFNDKLNELYRNIYILKPKNNHLIYPYQSFLIDRERDRLERKNESLDILFDQLFLFIMFNDEFNSKIINDNIKYFSEQSKHSDLNQLLLNLVSSDIIKDEDFNQFFDSVSIFEESLLLNNNGIDFGIIGLVYIFMTYRLSGLRHDGHKFIVDSLISKDIKNLEFDIKYHQYVGTIRIKKNSARLDWKY